MKKISKEIYESPVTEIISANISPVMYETSIPQAGDDETGGEADSKPNIFPSEDEDENWLHPGSSIWED
ncbi:hypothetical protein [Prevotella veroralis]|uniref:hypothetical protein n=1 Tax=Prevotella veroralis TaxID=28137 RepID=UPI000367CACA|nr:hypothetical protein [Prevotella veroralis]